MKKDEAKKNTLKKMWHDKRGKAILKLGIYFAFFLLMAMTLIVMSIFNKPRNEVTNPPKENQEIQFLSPSKMWQNLLSQDYHYKYQILTKENKEVIIFEGDKNSEGETGYRESKIGIIKYRIKENKIYQIFMDKEEEISNLYEEEDIPYLILPNLYQKLNTIIPETSKSGTTKILKYQENDIQIEVKMTTKQITSIQIMTTEKEYKLSFQMLENQNNIETN